MGKFIDITGQRFGRWTVLERAPNIGNRTAWLCRCDCGEERIVPSSSLRCGVSKSCGCLCSELSSERLRKQQIGRGADGRSATRLYRIRHGMIQRCENPNNAAYSRYGKRGVYVCQEWRDSFKAFSSWAFANGYNDSLSIDRIDVNGPYSPENCRWVNACTQQNNTRNNKMITYAGETTTLAMWAKKFGVSRFTLGARIQRGWPIERALKTPVKSRKYKKK